MQQFELAIQINLIGTFRCIANAALGMVDLEPLEDGEKGVIINTASVAAEDGQIGQAAYSASKGGVLAMTLPIARDLMNDGVRVNTILPGVFKTPMVAMMPENVQDALGAQVPFPKRLGKAEEYARLALFPYRERLHERRVRPPRRRNPDGAALIASYARLDRRAGRGARARPARQSGRSSRRGFEVEAKRDTSPVTEADHAAELVILAALARAAPGVPVIAEEEVAAGRIPAHDDTYFLVDPLDGTKEFIRGGDDYTVNIGLIERGTPKLGVVFAPATGRLHGGCVGEGAWLDEGAAADRSGPAAAGSKSPRSLPSRTSTRRPSIISKPRSAPATMCRLARRSNSASSLKARPTSIPVPRRPASGTRQRVTQCYWPRAGWSTARTERRCATASRLFSTGRSSRRPAGSRRGSSRFSSHFPGGGDLPQGV